MHKSRDPENPKKSVPSQTNPKTNRKTPINNTKKAQKEEVEE